MDTIDTGADAGGDVSVAEKPLLEQMAEEQQAAEALEDAGGGQEPPAPPADTAAPSDDGQQPGEQPQEPLTNEEYQKRHKDITAALREERQEKRLYRDEVAQLRAEIEQLRTSQPQQFQQFTLDQQIAQYDGIDWDREFQIDPAQAAEHKRILEQLTARRDEQHQASEQQRTQALIQTFTQTVQRQEADFKAAKPDYLDAVNFLRNNLIQEAQTNGYFGDQAAEYANRRIIEVSARVHASGRNVAEFGYNMALENGYQPPAPPAPDIASVKAGAEAAKSISTLGPKSSNDGGSFEENMANLSGAAAKAYWEKAKKQSFG